VLSKEDEKEIINMDIISSRKQISNLMSAYMITQYEWVAQFWTDEVPEWTGKRQAAYSNGVVFGKFREHDPATIQMLKKGVSDSALESEILRTCKDSIEALESIVEPDIMEKKKLEMEKRLLQELSLLPLDDWIYKNCGWANDEKQKMEHSEFRVLLYLYYVFEDINRKRRHPCCTDSEQIDSVYKNMFDKQSQFKKYGLLPVDDSKELMIIDPPRLYDKSVNKTLFLRNISKELLKQLSDMVDEGVIGNLSVRASNYDIFDGRSTYQYLAHAVERGKVFEFSNLGTRSITRLYSDTYCDCLWVNIDSENITFEELCEDFHVFENAIVTQVVHMQYIIDLDEAFITHLDHEYIFYTVDEYDARCNDIEQKGEADIRLKSFKVDNAKIPFDKRCSIEKKDEHGNELPASSEQFLCYVLECYFSHKDLLKEYFQNL
jgi:hypothetical protein